MNTTVRAHIGIGANLGDPVAQILKACVRLGGDIPNTSLVGRSRLYRNPPMGPQDQPDYVNAVACVDTRLSARDLLVELQRLEADFGRSRDGTRWGPRLLDLDILLYGDAVIDEPGLHVPHPGIAERAFVLIPLQELAPETIVPGLGSVRDLCRRLEGADLVAVSEEECA